MGVVALRRAVPLPAAVVAADQGGGDDRAARGHSRPSPPGSSATRPSSRRRASRPNPYAVYQFLGVPVDLDQIIVYICVVVTVVVGAVVLRYTEVGLKVRAMVDSPAMTDLSGTNPTAISVGRLGGQHLLRRAVPACWPRRSSGSTPINFTLLIAASFAAVVAAKLRNLPVAVLRRAPHGRGHVADPALPAVGQPVDHRDHRRHPLHRHRAVLDLQPGPARARSGETEGWGGALDRAITPQGESRLAGSTSSVVGDGVAQLRRQVRRPAAAHRRRGRAAPDRRAATGSGCSPRPSPTRVIFLSWTIVTGEGGMLWLCQITFAGVGA